MSPRESLTIQGGPWAPSMGPELLAPVVYVVRSGVVVGFLSSDLKVYTSGS